MGGIVFSRGQFLHSHARFKSLSTIADVRDAAALFACLLWSRGNLQAEAAAALDQRLVQLGITF
jgi:hypothetical protein